VTNLRSSHKACQKAAKECHPRAIIHALRSEIADLESICFSVAREYHKFFSVIGIENPENMFHFILIPKFLFLLLFATGTADSFCETFRQFARPPRRSFLAVHADTNQSSETCSFSKYTIVYFEFFTLLAHAANTCFLLILGVGTRGTD
jgi:hypothetical protein